MKTFLGVTKPEEDASFENIQMAVIYVTVSIIVISILEITFYFLYNSKVNASIQLRKPKFMHLLFVLYISVSSMGDDCPKLQRRKG